MSLEHLKALKERRNIKNLQENLNKVSNKYQKDERLWFPERDKNGTCQVKFRFLPTNPEDGDYPDFIKIVKHSFKKNGNWYIDYCQSTQIEGASVGTCPVCEYNGMKGKGLSREDYFKEIQCDSNGKYPTNRGPIKTFLANVLILDDKITPENNGQVKLFEFKKEILEILEEKVNPKFGDEKVDPFDPWEGANFNFRIYKNGEGRVKYDKSSWDDISPIADTDEEIDQVLQKCTSLKTYLKELKFKTYEQAKKRMNFVLGLNTPTPVTEQIHDEPEIESSNDEVDKDFEKEFNDIFEDDDIPM